MNALRAIDNAIEILEEDGAARRISPFENAELLDLRDARDAVARVEGCLNWLAMIENTLKSDPRCTGENGAPLTGLRAVRAVMRNLIAETEYQREVERAEYLEDR